MTGPPPNPRSCIRSSLIFPIQRDGPNRRAQEGDQQQRRRRHHGSAGAVERQAAGGAGAGPWQGAAGRRRVGRTEGASLLELGRRHQRIQPGGRARRPHGHAHDGRPARARVQRHGERRQELSVDR